jgi:hypothetical protein
MDIPEPITIDISRDLTAQYMLCLRHHEEEVGLILKGHLFVEFVLNEVIRRQLVSPRNILNDHRSYTFSVKLQIVYSMGYLPAFLYANIGRINKLRNHLAHNLTLNLDPTQFRFTRFDGEEILISKHGRHTRYPTRFYCKMLCFGTLGQLRNHFMLTFGELPVHPDVHI